MSKIYASHKVCRNILQCITMYKATSVNIIGSSMSIMNKFMCRNSRIP